MHSYFRPEEQGLHDISRTNAVLLVADVTASVELYERLGDTEAFGTIADMLDKLNALVERAGGQFVQSRGDDVLCAFSNADDAAAAAAEMLDDVAGSDVALHIALHAGEAIWARESIFGDAVNVTYRLASIANTNEALASGAAAALLSPGWKKKYRPLRAFRFKGKALPVDVLTYHKLGHLPHTQLPDHLMQDMYEAKILLRLSYGGKTWQVREAESLTIGRDDEVDLQIPHPWISRRHAVFVVRDGLATLTDRSTYGSFLSQGGAVELRVRRTSVTLSGAGSIALGTAHDQPGAECIEYAVIRAPQTAHPAV